MLARLKPKPGEKQAQLAAVQGARPRRRPRRPTSSPARPESVKSGRRIEELVAPPPPAGAGDAAAARDRCRARSGRRLPERLDAAARRPGRPSRPPGATGCTRSSSTATARWRIVDGDAVRLITRGGLDWTHRYGDLADAFRALPCRRGDDRRRDRRARRRRASAASRCCRTRCRAGAGNRAGLLRLRPPAPRRLGPDRARRWRGARRCSAQLAGRRDRRARRSSSATTSPAAGAPSTTRSPTLGLEGVVSKRASAPYQPGRSKTWTKAKAQLIGDFVIAGFTLLRPRPGLGALALASGRTASSSTAARSAPASTPRRSPTCSRGCEPLDGPALALDGAPKDILWVRPVLVARASTTPTSPPTARCATRSSSACARSRCRAGEPAPRQRLISEADLATVWVTNPTRRLFGRSGPTKLDVAVYYAGGRRLHAAAHRSAARSAWCAARPGGRRTASSSATPSSACRRASPASRPRTSDGEDQTYLTVEDAKGYLALAQFGVVEFHTWGCRRAATREARPGRPRPRPRRGHRLARGGRGGGARARRARGARPRRLRQDHRRQGRARRGAGHAASSAGRRCTQATGATRGAASPRPRPTPSPPSWAPTNRKRRIFIDFHRNARSATAVAPYSLRARNNLPASAPLTWEDLETVDAPGGFELFFASGPGGRRPAIPGPRSTSFARDLPAPRRVKG